MKHQVVEGKKYIVSANSNAKVIDTKYNIQICEANENTQVAFIAISNEVETDIDCLILPSNGKESLSIGNAQEIIYPGWVGYIEYDDETGEAIAADLSGVAIHSWDDSLKFNNVHYRGEWNSDMPYLVDSDSMFKGCENLMSFKGNLSALETGDSMFDDCPNLTTFESDLSSLTSGLYMFGHSESGCTKLGLTSVQNIADTINDVNYLTTKPQLEIGISIELVNDEELTIALNKIRDKGWNLTEFYA